MTRTGKEKCWLLDDAAARARANPYTFWKPSKELAERVEPGDYVKLTFSLTDPGPDAPNAERMWVEVTGRKPNSFWGKLDSEPQYISDLSRGSVIEFEEKHIIDASIEDPVPAPTLQWMPRCFVTNRVIVDGEQVGFLYREEPDREEDSGWRFMCGDESDDYMDSAKNIQLVSLGAVLSCDDRVLSLLDHAAPVAFQWDTASKTFVIAEMPAQD